MPSVIRRRWFLKRAAVIRDIGILCFFRTAVRAAVPSRIPVTVKFRKGWDSNSVNAVEFAKMAEQSGAAALTIHGRTRQQMYAPSADWQIIKAVKDAVKIPVIGNGDVDSVESAVRMYEQTGVDLVMIGRGALGNPWLFQQCAAALRGEPIPERPPLAQRIDVAVEQIELTARQKGERVACLMARRQYILYLKGIPHAGYYKEKLCRVETLEQIYEITKGIKRDLRDPEE